jgi:MazG family protein
LTAGHVPVDFRMFSELLSVVSTLRRRCPWDRKQTIASTRPLVLNEMYELDEALGTGDRDAITEELGDYLFMGLFLADVLAREKGVKLRDALDSIVHKLKLRHPHIYGKEKVRSADDVLRNWETIKRREKGDSLLASVPRALPALRQAHLIQERCRRVGFDWDDPRQVLDKVAEEVNELRHELRQPRRSRRRIAEELGDLVFALVNLTRHLDLDAEGVLRDANRKFTRRFQFVEREFARQGRGLRTVPLAEMEAVWQLAKRKPRARDSGKSAATGAQKPTRTSTSPATVRRATRRRG